MNNKQLLDEVSVISGIKVEVSEAKISIKIEVSRIRLIPLTSTLIFPDITNTETNALLKKRIDEPCFYINVCHMPLTTRALGIALGNHALRAQPTDY